jgi:cobalt-zinc-cadmium efflux system outer membrane protein
MQFTSIDEATNLGLKENLNLLAAKYDIDIARANEITARLWPNPNLNAISTLNPFGKNYNQTSSAGPRQLDVTLGIPVDANGKIPARIQYTKSLTNISEILFNEQIRLTMLLIRFNCIDLILQDAQYKLLRDKESNLSSLVKTIQNRIGSSSLQPLLLNRAKLAVDQASVEVRMAKMQRDITARNLANVLGLKGNVSIRFLAPLRENLQDSIPENSLLNNRAKDNLPSILVLKLAAESSDRARELSEAEVWDNINVAVQLTRQFDYDGNSNDLTSNRLPGQNSFGFGLTVPLPIFDRHQGDIQKFKILKVQYLKRLTAYELEIEKEIQNLHSKLDQYRKFILEMEKEQLPKAILVLNSQKRLFGTGGSNLLEYFDSINAYNATLNTYYTTVADYRKNSIRLKSLIGINDSDSFKTIGSEMNEISK